jgi:hypothetical protein
MRKHFELALLSFMLLAIGIKTSYADAPISFKADSAADSIATRKAIINIINTVIKASGSFEVNTIANYYTPNALVADEEPPFSWNGPTAGVQWVNTVEKTCHDLKIKNLKGRMGRISIYMQTSESVYLVVPVNYSGEIRDQNFEEEGAFTFVFRLVNGKWLIKSQVWVPRRGL